MYVAVAADHGGYQLKEYLKSVITAAGHHVVDLGTDSEASVDYPAFAQALAQTLRTGKVERGILVCGTGIGMSIAANRFEGIRAALCTSVHMAEMSRAHNNANVLCLGGRVLSPGEAEAIVKVWLDAPFETGGRHDRRLAQIPVGCSV